MTPAPELFERRLDAHYSANANGRIVGTNEWDSRPAPRFHLMRTAEGSIARFRADLSEALVGDLLDLSRRETWDEAPDRRLPFHYGRMLRLLAEHAPVDAIWSGPAYMAAHDVCVPLGPVMIDAGNADLLRPLFAHWLADVPRRRPFLAMVEGSQAVAICASVRISPAVHCAGVETHPAHRRRGHARRAVGAWACSVRSLGATPFYSTSWENAASQAVAGRLGFHLVGADFHVT